MTRTMARIKKHELRHCPNNNLVKPALAIKLAKETNRKQVLLVVTENNSIASEKALGVLPRLEAGRMTIKAKRMPAEPR